MKKMTAGIILFFLCLIFTGTVIIPDHKADTDHALASPYFGTDSNLPDFPETGEKGTDQNPFIILEIVPYEGYAEIGYMVSGCEPIPLDWLTFDDNSAGCLASTKGFTREWLEEFTNSLPPGDSVGTGPGQWEYLSWSGKYRRYRNYFKSSNSFLKNTLLIPESDMADYHIHVITITPDRLNNPANHRLIDRADLIYLTPKCHYGDDYISVWEKYYPAKKIQNEPQNFYSNDLTWETTVKIIEKAATNIDPAPVIFDINIFTSDQSYNTSIEPKKYYSTGAPVLSLSATGYSSNTAKLYLLMQEMGPSKFYNEFIATGRVIPVKVKDSSGKQLYSGSVPMTTGCLLEQSLDITKDYTIKGTADASAVWNIHTLLPYNLFKDASEQNGGKAFEAIGYIIFTYDANISHSNIRHGFFAYTGDNSITQLFLDKVITENNYNMEAFDYYENIGYGIRPSALAPSQALHYLLNNGCNYYGRNELRILEIEPCNDFIWDGTGEEWDTTKLPGEDFNNGSLYARQYLSKYFPHYRGKVKITTVTSSEFIGGTQDINSAYDLVIFGLKDGMLRKDSAGVTVYNDTHLNGKVYLHVGDKIRAKENLRGVFGDIDTNDFYRFSGNDITKKKRLELVNFVKAGHPILFERGFLKSYGTLNEVKLDNNSQLYSLASGTGNGIFFSDQLNVHKLETALASSGLQMIFGKTDGSLPVNECYPVIYRDRTREPSLTDKDIYINGETESSRTLKFRFYIRDYVIEDKTYAAALYIDRNADGKFDALTEKVSGLNVTDGSGYAAGIDCLKEETDYTVTVNLDRDFTGYIPWKLEITDTVNTDNRCCSINYSAVKRKEEDKQAVNILQIMPDTGNTFDLADHALFKEYSSKLNDYILHIKTMRLNEFSTLCTTGAYTYLLADNNEITNNIKNEDGMYEWDDYDSDGLLDVDILILGFADLYTDISNENALKNIEEYISENKTVIFTHDLTSYVNLPLSTYTGGADYWGYQVNKRFREAAGMDRFGVTKYADSAERLAAGKDYTTDSFIQGYTDTILNQYAAAGMLLNNINFPVSKDINTEYVTGINKGQLTTYPFEIDESFKASMTHSQYYQLDLENKDTTVWYCLSDNSKDLNGKADGLYSTSPKDVRNHYYIYKKNNITYSGIGHSEILQDFGKPGAVMETKLFINTVIAACYGAAKDPVLEITNTNKSIDSAGMNYVYVDYDIYDTKKSYGKDNGGGLSQKIKFRVTDNNVLYNKKLTVEYYDVNTDTGALAPLSLETKSVALNTVAGELQSGEEYYIEVPLGSLDYQNRGNTTLIQVRRTYGPASSCEKTVSKTFTLVRRGLFDLK